MPICQTALNLSEGLAFAQNWTSISAISSKEEPFPPDHVARLAWARLISLSSMAVGSTPESLLPRQGSLKS